MRILFFNQYGPGDSSPTARLLVDLSAALKEKGWAVDWAVDSTLYGKRKKGWRRWLAELWIHAGMVRKGLFSARPDVVVSLTSPACLVVTASLVSVLRGVRHIHWAMDLYPDLALVLGEIRPGVVSRVLKGLAGRAYRTCERVVALDADMQEYLSARYGISSVVIRPWPALTTGGIPAASLLPRDSGSWIWLYSGNLGRAHEWETLLEVQSLLEKDAVPAKLIFQGDGTELLPARKRAEELGLRNCFFRSYAPPESFVTSLLEASVLIATRKPEVRGLLWPSKLALLEGFPRPLLWVGDTDGHVAKGLKTREKTGVFAPGESGKIRRWLVESEKNPDFPGTLLSGPEALRQEGLGQWMALLAVNRSSEGLACAKTELK